MSGWYGVAAAIGLAAIGAANQSFAEQLDYAVVDPRLAVTRIDQSPDAAFVAVRADSAGRLFVGGRESIYVYEPTADGGFAPRRELFRFPPHSWVFDLVIRGEDIYAATASAVYLLPGAVTRRDGIAARRLLWGQPIGHLQLGLFGLAWGPEGDLYVSLGDPLQHYGDFHRPDHWGHWTFFGADGSRLPYTGVGGVLRCRPDGSRLQVVSSGIFRCCGLAFDDRWNLFTNDNDREAMPALYVPARVLHAAPRSYFGWPRGWLVEKTPQRADLLDVVYRGLGRDAPVGLSFYDDDLLPAEYRKSLLLCRWASRQVTVLKLAPAGSSFRAKEQPFLVAERSARPVGVCVGLDGRVFVTLLQMPQLEGSPVCPSELAVIGLARADGRRTDRRLTLTTVPSQRLWDELAAGSFSRRSAAHAEILRRGGVLLAEAAVRLERTATSDPAFAHLVWLAGAAGDERAKKLLLHLTNLSDIATRLAAIRALAEFDQLRAPASVFEEALGDSDVSVRRAAVVAFFNDSRGVPWVPIVRTATESDRFLRQAACLLLAERGTLPQIERLCADGSGLIRLAGVLAAGFRLTLPPATQPIPEQLALSPYPDSACVIQYADERVDLRKFGRVGNFTTAEHWKAGAHTPEQEQLFRLLAGMLGDADEQVRLQAAHFLYLLNDPRSEPLVAKLLRETDERRLAAVPVSEIRTIGQFWVAGPFADGGPGFGRSHPPERGAVDPAAEYTSDGSKQTWRQMAGGYLDFRKTFGSARHASCYAYCRLESPVRQRILLFAGSSDGVKIWHNGRVVWENVAVRPALQFEDSVLLELEAGSNNLLLRVQNVEGEWGLFAHYKALGEVAATLPERLGTATLAERLRAAKGADPSAVSAAMANVDWDRAVAQSDPERGRKLFGADGLGCAKCHTTAADQAGGNGPSLAEARKRFTLPYLVESILLPNQSVSPTFRASLVALQSGEQLTGLVVGETLEKIELLLSDGSRKPIEKNNIAARKQLESSPMPSGIVKTPNELGDLLAYLLGE